jgi:hypothetical protein
MKHPLYLALIACLLIAIPAGTASAADAKATSLTCVGLYSETSDGYVSSRVAGKGEWVPVKVGDVLTANAEIKINVDRDWVEFIQTGKPASVYEVDGPQSGGEVVMKVADILKVKPRAVAFPNGTKDKPDPKYKDKLVVTKYLGRQIYMTADGDSKDIKYGDVLPKGGKVKIIAINNTIDLVNANGATATVIGPVNFTVVQVLENKSLYKYLNVQK